MDPFTLITASLAGATAGTTAWGAWWKKVYSFSTGETEVHYSTTEDGWQTALCRYKPEEIRFQFPVVLCHGLGANRLSFDLAPETSLARYLQNLGFDTWVVELRGRGISQRPWGINGRWYTWSFDHYVNYDAPAALAKIREITGVAAAHWVGHSMGGMILYAYLGRGGSGIHSAIVAGSTLDFSDSNSTFRFALPFRKVARLIPLVPNGPLSLTISPLAGRLSYLAPQLSGAYWPPNMDPLHLRRLRAHCIHSISPSVLLQLATAFTPGGLVSECGEIQYQNQLPQLETPILALAGDRDLKCPAPSVEKTASFLGEKGKYLLFGKEAGHSTHYGHIDLLMGKNAPHEVFPSMVEWLEKWDGEG